MSVRLDLSKYEGSYSVEEAKEISKQIGNDILEAQKKEALEDAEKIYGGDRTYEIKKGDRIDLRTLEPNQRVCASGIKGYHILMTEKS